MLAESEGLSSGYCWELVTSSTRVVACDTVLVPIIISSQVICVTKLQFDGLIE